MNKISFPAVLICMFSLLSCNNTGGKEAPIKDSMKTGEKKLPDLPVSKDNASFELKTNVSTATAKGITLVLENDKKLTLDKYPQYYDNGQGDDLTETVEKSTRDSAIRCLIDIDQDNTPELITQYFTGGAHCCDVSDVFTKTSENTYKRICHYRGIISPEKNGITLAFREDLGYFSTCYACSIEDDFKWPADVERDIKLELKNGAFSYAAKSDKMNEGIEADLNALKARGIPNIKKDDMMDDGTRREYALLLVTYYFNTDRDLAKIKELFLKYYNNADKNKIWKDLEEYINSKTSELKKNIKFQ